MTEVICTCCPNGCTLAVDELNGFAVTGNRCPRGAEFGKSELLAPVRTVTGTARLEGGRIAMLPVKTAAPVPRDKMAEIMQEISRLSVSAPVKCGDVLLENAANTGISIVSCRTVSK